MRLLMTADTAGGVWVHALALSDALSQAGVQVRLVALGAPSSEQQAAARSVTNVELVVRPVRLEWMSDPWPGLDALEPELLTLAADCDLVHLNHLVHGHLSWGRPVICAVHSCVLSWHEAVRGGPAPADWRRYQERVARSLQAADQVVGPSEWILRQAGRHYGPLHRRSVIANGSGAPLGDPHAPRRGVVAAGRVWDEAKNLAMLEHLWADHAGSAGLSEPLLIAGPRQTPDAAGASGPGSLPQDVLWAEMRRASVFAAPALYEPFGLGVLEAARSGCALLLADIPTLRELWQGAAAFADPRRPEQWQSAIADLLADPAERLRLARAAWHRAGSYTLERMAHSYLALYRRTVALAAEGVS